MFPIRKDSFIDNLVRNAEIRRVAKRKGESVRLSYLYEAARATKEQVERADEKYKRTEKIFDKAMKMYDSTSVSFIEAYNYATDTVIVELESSLK